MNTFQQTSLSTAPEASEGA